MDRIETKEWNEGRMAKAKVLLCHLDDSGSKGSPEGKKQHHRHIFQPHSGRIMHQAPQPHLPYPPRGWVKEAQKVSDSPVLARTYEGVNAH